MSEEYKAERISAVPGAAEFPGGYPMPRRRAYHAYSSSSAPSTALDEHDVTSIFGLPPDSVSPEILKSLQKMLTDVGDLRGRLDASERNRRHLEDQADLYPGLPCLNGHAFLRELDAFLFGESGRGDTEWGRLAVIHVDGIERAVGRLGTEVGAFALRYVWDVFHRAASEGEPLAYLGFGTFCWLLLGPEGQGVPDRLNGVLDALRQAPPVWRDRPIEIGVSAGVAPLLADLGAAQALDQADKARLRLTEPMPSDSVPG